MTAHTVCLFAEAPFPLTNICLFCRIYASVQTPPLHPAPWLQERSTKKHMDFINIYKKINIYEGRTYNKKKVDFVTFSKFKNGIEIL